MGAGQDETAAGEDIAASGGPLPRLPGVVAALVTPYNGYGGIDTDAVGRLVERAIGGGVAGLLVNGAIGEAAHLSRGERLFVIEAAREAARGRVPLWAGTGAVGAEETLALTWDAGKAGVDAAVVAAPFYYRLSQAALLAHYREIARRGRLPLVVQNAPTALGNALAPATLAELARVPGIVGISEGARELGYLAETLRLVGDACPVLAGDDAASYPALCAGARGLVSAVAGVLPEAVVGLVAAHTAGHGALAEALWRRLAPLGQLLIEQGEAVAVCKAALDLLDLPGGEPRRPLPGLDEVGRKRVRDVLAAIE